MNAYMNGNASDLHFHRQTINERSSYNNSRTTSRSGAFIRGTGDPESIRDLKNILLCRYLQLYRYTKPQTHHH